MRSLVAHCRTLVTALLVAGLTTAAGAAQASSWVDIALVSSTLGNTANKLCVGAGRTDLGCPLLAPTLNPTTGGLTVTGDVTVTGVVSATAFVGNGAGITNLNAANISGLNLDRITSGSSVVSINGTTGLLNLQVSGSAPWGYLAASGFSYLPYLNTLGVSATGTVTATQFFAPSTADGVKFGQGPGTGMGTAGGNNLTFYQFGAKILDFANSNIETYAAIYGNDNTFYIQQSGGINLPTYGFRNASGFPNNAGIGSDISNGLLSLITSGTSRVAITSTGLVGIGTTAPSATLHVMGTIQAGLGGVNGFLNLGNNARNVVMLSSNGNSGGNGYLRLTDSNGVGGTQLGPYSYNYINDSLGLGYTGLVNAKLQVQGSTLLNYGTTVNPSATLQVSGSIMMSQESNSTLATCDANRLGAIRYSGGMFSICQTAANGWESLATTGANSLADRITSNSMAGVIANATGYISFTTGGVTGTAYINPQGVFTLPGVSATGVVSADSLSVRGVPIGVSNGNYVFGPNLRTMTGGNNTAMGTSAMASTGAGGNNTAYGRSAAQLTTGGENTAVGSVALTQNVGGSQNTAVGRLSLANLGTGNNNTAVGMSSLQNLVGNAGGNTALGSAAGSASISGNYNLLLGNNTQTVSNTTSYGLNIGNTIFGDMTNAAAAGNKALVGINNPTPVTALDVSGTLKMADSGESCDATHLGAIRYNSNQFYICRNAAVGWETLTAGGTGVGVSTFASLTDTVVSASSNVMFADNALTGANAGVTNTTAFGIAALANTNNSGYANAAFGDNVLRLNTSGYQNTGVGSGVLAKNTTATGNTGVGYAALALSTSNFNTAVGRGAGGATTTGAGNTDIGYGAGNFNVSGNYSTMLGYQAGYANGGSAISYTTALGTQAGYNLVSSTDNVLVGYRSGFNLATGNYNVLLGDMAGSGLTTGSNNIMIGYNVQPVTAADSNTLNIGNLIYGSLTGHNVGISTTTPQATLDVSGTLKMADSGESCDATHLGAMRYAGGNFSICRNAAAGWENIGAAVSGTSVGVTAFASLTDVSVSAAGGNMFAVNSLAGTTSGAANDTAYGLGALSASGNSGGGNTAIGRLALSVNTTGGNNTATGLSALQNNLGGYWNTANGSQALQANTSGVGNTAAGYQSLVSNTTGSNNTASGVFSMYNNISGIQNTATGVQALNSNITGSGNTALGFQAGYNAASTSNTLIGWSAGSGLTTGSNNIFIGYNVQPGTAADNNKLNIGNTVYGDLSTGNVTVGSNSRGAYFTVNNSVKTASVPLLTLTSSDAGSPLQLLITRDPTAHYISSIEQGVAWRNLILQGGGGMVGIGIVSPTAALHVSGSAIVSGTVQMSGTSADPCSVATDTGKLHINPTTGQMELCVLR